jgi:Xaa-Pro aminopeptidase
MLQRVPVALPEDDVTRTYAVSGDCTPERTDIYDIVLATQEDGAIRLLEPSRPQHSID